MPLHRRLPKKGFSNVQFRDVYEVVNVGCLNDAFEDGGVVNEASLRERNLVNRNCDAIKILGTGELTRKLTIEISNVSASAREKIEKAGGSVVVVVAVAEAA
jgi:large subunit ribosomal protein L15